MPRLILEIIFINDLSVKRLFTGNVTGLDPGELAPIRKIGVHLIGRVIEKIIGVEALVLDPGERCRVIRLIMLERLLNALRLRKAASFDQAARSP